MKYESCYLKLKGQIDREQFSTIQFLYTYVYLYIIDQSTKPHLTNEEMFFIQEKLRDRLTMLMNSYR